jgi:archaellin
VNFIGSGVFFLETYLKFITLSILMVWFKKSAMGIATMIIFIALLLVAAITAGVLILSQSDMQEETLNTATATRREVTTQIELFQLTGTDGTDGSLDDFKYNIRLKPGAEPIRLTDVVLYVSTDIDTLRLIYKEGECRRDVTNGYFTYR